MKKILTILLMLPLITSAQENQPPIYVDQSGFIKLHPNYRYMDSVVYNFITKDTTVLNVIPKDTVVLNVIPKDTTMLSVSGSRIAPVCGFTITDSSAINSRLYDWYHGALVLFSSTPSPSYIRTIH